MSDSAFRLQDKTIFLAGPFNAITQSLLRTMTEFSSDIALVNDQTPGAVKYTDGLNEAREVHPEYGRAAHLNLPLRGPRDISEALGRLTESLGRADVLIDATPLGWTAETDRDGALEVCRHLAEQVIPFLAAKQKGRVLYLFEDESLSRLNAPVLPAELRGALSDHIRRFARELRGRNITVNGLSLGLTEDFLLRHFAKGASLRKCLEELQKEHAGLRLVESLDVGMGAAFLAGALSASVTGSILRLTHGFHLNEEPGSTS